MKRLIALAAALAALSGCYIARQGAGLLRIVARADEIERVLASPHTTPEVRTLLELVQDVRRFGMEEVGLAENRSYTTYVTIDRDHVVDVVSATADDSFSRHTWWFPFFGSFPYKGFYDREDAERLARKLERRSLDVIIRPVDAFSTLGFFRDPVYSFMSKYSVFDVASLVLHEQTHATLFLKNQTQFNEELASFVGTEGALEYLRRRHGDDSEEYRRTLLELRDDKTFTEILRGIRAQLQAVYDSDLDRSAKLEAKRLILSDERKRFASDYEKNFATDRYRAFARARVNNAYLDLYATYTEDRALFEQLYEASGRDLKLMIERLLPLKEIKGDPKEHIRTQMLCGTEPASPEGGP